MAALSLAKGASGNPLTVFGVQAAIFVAFFVIIQVLSDLTPLFPGLPELSSDFVSLVTSRTFYFNLGVTIFEAALGLAIAFVIGVALGIVVGASRAATEAINPIILAAYSIPKIIFLPLLLILFGVGMEPKIANAALHAVFPILLNAMVGMREVNPLHRKVALSLGGGTVNLIKKVYLPSIAPPLLTGVRLAVGLAFMGALLAELFQSTSGIGHLLLQTHAKGQIGLMLSIVFAMFLLILGLNYFMRKMESRIVAWRRSNDRD